MMQTLYRRGHFRPFLLLLASLPLRLASGLRKGLFAAALFAGGQGMGAHAAERIEALPDEAPKGMAIATFAGGCFWCMEPPFDKLDGVVSTTSGHTGGHVPNVTYKQVSRGNTGHTEAVRVVYDPARVSYADLLKVYWRQINPTTPGRQFCDVGSQYRPEIFVHDAEQRELAEASRRAIAASGRFDGEIQVPVTDASVFWAAEGYHQDYYLKNPVRYKYYRFRCGRDQYLEAVWGEGNY